MNFLIDIGNTHIVMGVVENFRVIAHWRIASHPVKTSDEFGVLIHNLLEYNKIEKSGIKGVVISSVVPSLNFSMLHMSQNYLGIDPMFVRFDMKLNIKIAYDDPAQVGADRIANAVAGYEIYRDSLIIIDFGTATTFDIVSRDGVYLGGLISPGILTASDELFKRAALLSKIAIEKPGNIIGRNTQESLKAGIYFGMVGQVREILRLVQEETGRVSRIISTGGMAEVVSKDLPEIDEVSPWLTLLGLDIIYRLNQKP